ncbi:hypothetical protein BCV70DRAFT_201632 [Testicularia cyperi]|uniref:Uncharacterized protein n=1 Tax=Testicularia cyperi TaxID=1882483 RepID=A0A317XLX4_9BASI|nr:hypothetical protein BCV70DRAFT_201632 [Testicularia cyperi]
MAPIGQIYGYVGHPKVNRVSTTSITIRGDQSVAPRQRHSPHAQDLLLQDSR